MLPVQRKKLSEEFEELAVRLKSATRPISLGEIVALASERGHSVLLVFLSLPFMIPIPLPGLSLVFGPVIFLAGLRIALSQPPWIPKRIQRIEISAEKAAKVFYLSAKILRRMEGFLKPRFTMIFQTQWIRPLDGGLLMCMGLLLALPLPPGTNFPPALSILCMGLGMLEKDGLFIFLSYFFFFLNAVVFFAIFFFGYEGFKLLNLY